MRSLLFCLLICLPILSLNSRLGLSAVLGADLSTEAQAQVAAKPPLKNWYDDPYFSISDAIPACPQPLGPLLSETEARAQAHSRVERGTSCWLAGHCVQANAYAYDQAISTRIRTALAQHHPFPQSSLWLTIQRRIVTIEGCVPSEQSSTAIHDYFRKFDNVDEVIVDVFVLDRQAAPYKIKP